MGGLRMVTPKPIDDPEQIIGHLDRIIAALKALGPSTRDTALENDPLITAWQLATEIRSTLHDSLSRSQSKSIAPEAMQNQQELKRALKSIPAKTDELFGAIHSILQDSRSIYNENMETMRIIPGIEVENRGAVDYFHRTETGDPEQDKRVGAEMQAGGNLYITFKKLEAAATGGEFAFEHGTYTTKTGYVDLAASVKNAAACFLGLRAR